MSNDYCNTCNELKKVNKDYNMYAIYPSCPNQSEDWHKQAELLQRKINKTPSRRLADIMQEELKEILTTKKVTKEIYVY